MQTIEERLAKQREWKQKNRDRVLAQQREYYARRGKQVVKKWIDANRDRVREMKRESDKRCRDQRIKSRRKYLETAKGKQWADQWYGKRMADPVVRVKKLLSGAKRRAMEVGIEFDPQLHEVLPCMPQIACPCCNCEFDYKNSKRGAKNSKTRTNRSPSLDRVDSTKGYTVDNTRVICWGCNSLKNNGTIEDFANILAYMRREIKCDVMNVERPSIGSIIKAVNGGERVAVVQ